jgi:ribosomal protein S18 acetylase RimI-like enzyme
MVMTSASHRVRLYQAADRPMIRKIACDTADRGEPVENFYSDREIIADLITRNYTDYEPESLWVAEGEGRVGGYLPASLAPRRYWKVTARRLLPALLTKALIRGAFFRRETWDLLHAMLKTAWAGGFKRDIPFDDYPAHLHINLDRNVRGVGIGRRLVEQFVEQARAQGARGVHLATRLDNVAGCGFFERVGFSELGRYPFVYRDAAGFQDGYIVVYGVKI